jgi:hypothetical protein
MNQEPLFCEDINDAIRATVLAVGGIKKVSADLWPTSTPDAAASRLRDCMNHDRRERLSPEELLAIAKVGREAGCHTLMAFICGDCGYGAPVVVDPQDERAELQREFVAGVSRLEQIAKRIERTNQLQVAGVRR